jgi:hypothetical protein
LCYLYKSINTNQRILRIVVNRSLSQSSTLRPWQQAIPIEWQLFIGGGFLVSAPVFVEAPLVRAYPLASVLLTFGWLWLGLALAQRKGWEVWGDLIIGFSWSWLAGAIYWGWLRTEPSLHIPIESIGIPAALWFLLRGRWRVGHLFYLGSLLGTAVTDLYIHIVGLLDCWKQLMAVDPSLATPILQQAIWQVRTPWGTAWGIVLVNLLLAVGIIALGTKQAQWYAFSGAVLTTILVDSLFLWAASII